MNNNVIALLTGASIGAFAMYVLDPQMGRRRRAVARDKMILAQKKTKEAAALTARDLKNRTMGMVAEDKSQFSEGEVADEVLEGRVRSELGFLVRHPSAIETSVAAGRVILIGPVLADEVDQLIAGIRSVRGVTAVENRLEVHDEPGNVPGLQGEKPKPSGRPLDIMQRHWSPSTRFLFSTASALALGLIAYSVAANGRTMSALPRRQKHNKSDVRHGEATAAWSA